MALGIISAFNAAASSELPVRVPTSSSPERIVGGTKSTKGEWPFMSALVAKGKDAYSSQSCGGSFLGDRYVLTAAHCVENVNPEELDVIVGIYDLAKESSQGTRVGVQSIYTHELYSDPTNNYDVAVIELDQAINSDAVLLAANNQEPLIGEIVTVIGWGNLQPNSDLKGIFPSELYDVDLPIVSRSTCKAAGDDYSSINEAAICAGFSDGGKDSCQGDSGGPLVQDLSGTPTQVGIISWGDSCAQAGKYGVYTNVAYLNDWITAQMNGVSYRQNVYFGFKEVGTKIPKTVTVKNNEITPFRVSSVSSSDLTQVRIIENQCEMVGDLQQGESCNVTVEVTVPLGKGEAEIVVNTTHADKSELKTTFHSYGLVAASGDVKSFVGLGDAVYANASPWEVFSTDTLKAGSTPRGQSSLLLIENVGKGELTFDARVWIQQDTGYFKMYVNENLIIEFTGYDESYYISSVNLSQNSNDIMFVYERGAIDYSSDYDTVYLQNIKLVTPDSGSSGGSLSFGWLLLLLPFAMFRNRRAYQ
nr:serine protease [Vibrio sp. S9_S30]